MIKHMNHKALEKSEIIQFLKRNFVMDMATVDGDKPAVAPVVYVMDEELNMYIVTYQTSYKAHNLLKNPHYSFTVWQFLQMSVQGSGVASVIEDKKKIEWVMDAFADAATRDPNFWAPIFRIKRGDYCVFQIKLTWLRALDLSRNTVRQEESPFTEISL
jgi:nitroimidazol reductase NimA-like FMN-containing flavoprotein (pyridoxamine 5'-phosphate oxidase superfamily)